MPRTTVTLTITLDATGNVQVNGPIENLVLFYGMLELARDAIFKHHLQKDQRIVPASMLDLPQQ